MQCKQESIGGSKCSHITRAKQPTAFLPAEGYEVAARSNAGKQCSKKLNTLTAAAGKQAETAEVESQQCLQKLVCM